MFSFIHLLFVCVLASRALAFNITLNNRNLTTSQILDIPESAIKTACATNCTAASSQIQSCKDDVTCLCNAATIAALRTCEQCMFTQLVTLNSKADFRVGSQALLAGYAASCTNASQTVATSQIALKLPADWDGPVALTVPVGGVVISVITAIFLGVSGITLISVM